MWPASFQLCLQLSLIKGPRTREEEFSLKLLGNWDRRRMIMGTIFKVSCEVLDNLQKLSHLVHVSFVFVVIFRSRMKKIKAQESKMLFKETLLVGSRGRGLT